MVFFFTIFCKHTNSNDELTFLIPIKKSYGNMITIIYVGPVAPVQYLDFLFLVPMENLSLYLGKDSVENIL